MRTFANKLTWFTPVLLLGCMLFLSSCEDEDDKKSSAIVLESFGPSGVHHGDEISFIGMNLDRVTSIVLRPAVEIPSSAFKSRSSDRIVITVPEEAEAGKVILKTPSGDIESKTILNFEVPVVITSITEEVKPGSILTITGDKINWIERVVFAGDIEVVQDDFVSQTQTQLQITVPYEAQTGYLIFYTGGTKPLSFGSEEQLIVTVPKVTEISPAEIIHTNNLTIKGSDLDLITLVVFGGGAEVASEDFASHSAEEIVVAVPATATKGMVTLKQSSPIDVEAGELTIILPAGTSVSPSPAVPGTDDITITGTNLLLVKTLLLPGNVEVAAENFIAHSDTEIKLAFPAGAGQGAVEFITIHDFRAPLGVVVRVPSTGSFPVLDYYIYKDGLQGGWQQYGGWGHVSQDYENEENPANGSMAIKTVFNDPWGAVQINNQNGPNVFAGYNYLVFYVHTNMDSEIIVQIGENGDYYPPAFTGNKYHQIVVPLADLQGANNVTELRIKNNNTDAPTNNTIVYIDEIGLTIDPPMGLLPELVTVFYDDEMKSPFGLGGGWGGSSTDTENIEQQRQGEKSIKAVFAGGFSGAAQFGAWGGPAPTTAGMQYFAFSIYGGAGTGGKTINVNIKPTTDGDATTVEVTVEEGKWKDVQIPLSEFGSPASIGEIQFQDTDWTGAVYIDHVGLM